MREQGWSSRKLAKEIGVSDRTLRGWLSSDREGPKWEVAKKLDKALRGHGTVVDWWVWDHPHTREAPAADPDQTGLERDSGKRPFSGQAETAEMDPDPADDAQRVSEPPTQLPVTTHQGQVESGERLAGDQQSFDGGSDRLERAEEPRGEQLLPTGSVGAPIKAAPAPAPEEGTPTGLVPDRGHPPPKGHVGTPLPLPPGGSAVAPAVRARPERKWRLVVGFVVLLLVVGGGFLVVKGLRPSSTVTITEPLEHATVAEQVTVTGKATMGLNSELWLLVHPLHGDPAYFVGTLEPLQVDASHAWVGSIRLGRPGQDRGEPFQVVAVVSPADGCIRREMDERSDPKTYPRMSQIPEDCSIGDQIDVVRGI